MMKKHFCRVCGVELNSSNWKLFLQKNGDYLCTIYWRERQREYAAKYSKDPQKRKLINARSKKYAKSHPKERKKLMREKLYREYGMTSEDFDGLYSFQQGRCAICGKHQSELKRTIDIDHNHITDEVRGLLCSKCNFGIGLFEVDLKGTDLLQKAVEYVKRRKS